MTTETITIAGKEAYQEQKRALVCSARVPLLHAIVRADVVRVPRNTKLVKGQYLHVFLPCLHVSLPTQCAAPSAPTDLVGGAYSAATDRKAGAGSCRLQRPAVFGTHEAWLHRVDSLGDVVLYARCVPPRAHAILQSLVIHCCHVVTVDLCTEGTVFALALHLDLKVGCCVHCKRLRTEVPGRLCAAEFPMQF